MVTVMIGESQYEIPVVDCSQCSFLGAEEEVMRHTDQRQQESSYDDNDDGPCEEQRSHRVLFLS